MWKTQGNSYISYELYCYNYINIWPLIKCMTRESVLHSMYQNAKNSFSYIKTCHYSNVNYRKVFSIKHRTGQSLNVCATDASLALLTGKMCSFENNVKICIYNISLTLSLFFYIS